MSTITSLETCMNCSQPIGRLETPNVWQGHVVCATCHAKLSRTPRQPSGLPVARTPPARYVDYLRWPRLVLLLLAIAVSALPLARPVDGPVDHTFAWLLWAAWLALGLAGIIMKASWRQRQAGV